MAGIVNQDDGEAGFTGYLLEQACDTFFISAAVEAGMHAVAVELDFVQPVVAVRRRLDQLRKLRRDAFRQKGAGPPA